MRISGYSAKEQFNAIHGAVMRNEKMQNKVDPREIKSLHREIKVLDNMAQGQWASLTTAFWRNVTRESLLLFFTAIFYVGNQVEISQVFLQYFRPGISWKLARFLLRAANQTKRLTASPWRRLSDSS